MNIVERSQIRCCVSVTSMHGEAQIMKPEYLLPDVMKNIAGLGCS